MDARGGVRREVVRTLQTGEYREAQRRLAAGLAVARNMVDAALQKRGLQPLTDWTTDQVNRRAAHAGWF